MRVARFICACYLMGYCRWAPAMLPRAPSKVSAGTGAGVPPTSTSQPRCQWEAGTQGEGRPPERAAGQPLSRPITRGAGATRRAHLRALPAAKPPKPFCSSSIVRKNDQVSRWIHPRGTPSVYQSHARSVSSGHPDRISSMGGGFIDVILVREASK